MVYPPERSSSCFLLPEREGCGYLSLSVLQVSLTCLHRVLPAIRRDSLLAQEEEH